MWLDGAVCMCLCEYNPYNLRVPCGQLTTTLFDTRDKMSKINENDEVRRLKINERERRRMHDLNSAMDGLRGAMPYARGKS